jgi:hypothetical protein
MDIEKIANDTSIHDEGMFYRLFDVAERVRWKMSDYQWSSLKKGDVSPAWIAVARAALRGELTTFNATERFFADFATDVDFTQWITVWLYEETKHPSAFVKYLDTFGEKFDSRFMLEGRQTIPFMPSKMGTMATNIVSEMVASALYYNTSVQPTIDPVLKQICRNLGGDEARHAASFYGFAKKRLSRSDNLRKDKLDALTVLYFWISPALQRRVGHPVKLATTNTDPLVQQAVPIESSRAAIEETYRRACRVFGSLLGLDLKDAKDVEQQIGAHA